jgi:hypothetical protein
MPALLKVVIPRLATVCPTRKNGRGTGAIQLVSRTPASISFLSENPMPQKTAAT